MLLQIWLNRRGLATPLGQENVLNLPQVQNPEALFPVVPSFYEFRISFFFKKRMKERKKRKDHQLPVLQVSGQTSCLQVFKADGWFISLNTLINLSLSLVTNDVFGASSVI